MIRKAACFIAAAFAVAAAGVAAPLAQAEEFSVCPSGLTGVATEDTSCAFADNVRTAWNLQPSAVVLAYSPVTQQSYPMQCTQVVTQTWPQAMRCAGVNTYGVGLVVFIATPSGASGPTDQSGASAQPIDAPPAAGVGVGADSPDLPYADAPNIGCTWVNSYTRSNGTRVSGHWRC